MSKKILYLVTEDWYFCSHRLILATEAVDKGYDVSLITRVDGFADTIREAGINLVPVDFQRSARYPLKDIRLLFTLVGLYRKLQPDLVHHVSLKPILFGSIAAMVARVPVIINTITGLGYLFSSADLRARIIRCLIMPFLLFFLNRKNSYSIFQNNDDQKDMSARGMNRENSVLIRGSGVEIEKFSVSAELDGTVNVILAARMLRYKGIEDFVKAAALCRQQKLNARFILVGDIDTENPMSLQSRELEAWQAAGDIEWWGHRNDMAEVLKQAHIVCLPTYYREGVPKILLEAAASGRPVITTNVPGCNDIVRHGENGLLVSPRDPEQLASALENLIVDNKLRASMGRKGRKLVEEGFTMHVVNEKTLKLYEERIRNHVQN